MEDIYDIFIGKDCKVILLIDGQTYVYTARILDYNPEKITFIDKFGNPYSYSSKLITELKLANRGSQ